MARRRRIPGLLDIMTIDDAAEIDRLLADRRIDRVPAAGPWLNRLITGRIRRMLTLNGSPLPTMASRLDLERGEAQAQLAAGLDGRARGIPSLAADDLAAVVDYVAGGPDRRAAGIALQSLVGRLFDADYSADRTTYAAAERVNRSLASRNPLRWLVDRMSGRSARAKDLLAARIGDNPAGLHATMIAFHNLVVTADRMRALLATRQGRGLSPDSAAALCLVAPETILREAVRPADTVAGPLDRGTLVAINLRKATDGRMQPGQTLLDGQWSQCPASLYVRNLVREIWRRAQEREVAR